MSAFRIALLIGVTVALCLSLAGLFPLTLVVGATLMPILTVLYMYDVDLYEDEPIRIVALTMGWGAAAGILIALLADAVSPPGLVDASTSDAVARLILIPLLSVVLMLAGPLALLRHRRFNDVLDGATFGVSSAVSFAGALAVTTGLSLLGSGLRPVGAVLPWIARSIELAVAVPVLYAGVMGGVAGSWWLRYRAPVRDRRALGWLGRPLIATGVAVIAVVFSAQIRVSFSEFSSLIPLLLLGGLALIWLRHVIHLGLIEEAGEIELGGEISCPNCGRTTTEHSFCGHCGISLRALPKGSARGGRES
jgi:RsiW-degrading membrane proteinase PrsW (M82 family)